MVFFFFQHAGSVKKGLSSSTTLSCPSAQIVWSTNLRIQNGPSCTGNLYVRYSELRNESQGESRKRVAGEPLPVDFIKIMIKDAEKSRPEQNPQNPRPKKKNKEEKPQEDILSRLDYFELLESDIPLKFAPCINGGIQVKLSSNKSNV